jgi:hypothetical protein
MAGYRCAGWSSWRVKRRSSVPLCDNDDNNDDDEDDDFD